MCYYIPTEWISTAGAGYEWLSANLHKAEYHCTQAPVQQHEQKQVM